LFSSSSGEEEEDVSNNSPTEEESVKVKGVTLKMAFDSNPTQWSVSDLVAPPERFTSPTSLDLVHRLRRESDAVLVGVNTVLRDDCTLTVRRVPLLEGGKQPVRVVIDPHLKVFTREKYGGGKFSLLKDGYHTIIYHSLSRERVKQVDWQGVDWNHVTIVNPTHEYKSNNPSSSSALSPNMILENLSIEFDINHVMVEGGPYTAKQFLQSSVVNRAILIRAPIEFVHPEVSGIDADVMSDAGLKLIGTNSDTGDDENDDTVEYWCIEEEEWPTDELNDWP